jgi:hypothetical protein
MRWTLRRGQPSERLQQLDGSLGPMGLQRRWAGAIPYLSLSHQRCCRGLRVQGVQRLCVRWLPAPLR